MKVWELEVGKLYATGGYIYKIDSSRNLSFLTKGNSSKWITTKVGYNVVVGFDFEEVKRELDWDKVPERTRVQVRDKDDERWQNAYYLGLTNDEEYPYMITFFDEFIYEDSNCDCFVKNSYFAQIQLHPSVEPQEDWFKEI